MSRTIRGLAALSLVLVTAACNRSAPVEDYVMPTASPVVTAEPVFTGKYN